MCGIAVTADIHGLPPIIDLRRLRHRGPDGAGVWRAEDGWVWLGHTRLSILDLSSAGSQPMIDPCGGNVLVFNGEIYNHQELRKELKARGIAWRGSSDTETLLVAYREWGEDMLCRLKGMFALALYDQRRQCVFLARDRLGIKPLYYSHRLGRFLACSESRPLGDIEPRWVNRAGVAGYLAFGACLESELLSGNIRSFPAGHWARLEKNGRFVLKRYWPKAGAWRRGGEQAPQRVRQLLEKAVEEHLLSDVPVASFLSGGIDSSIITALASQRLGRRLRTFTLGFAHRELDETAIAERVARQYGTDHYRIELTESQILEWIREAVERMDLPSVDAINTYIIARSVAERGCKVALTGLGGDELFGGYATFRQVSRLELVGGLPGWIRQGLALCGHHGERLAELPSPGVMGRVFWRRRFWTDRMLRGATLPAVRVGQHDFPDLPDAFARISWAELTGYMRHMLLRDADQMSMAVSLELRVPFLDHELVEYVLGLPSETKTRGRQAKGLLIEACRDLLPETVYRRRKMGFTLPMREWLRGPLQPLAAEGLRLLGQSTLVPRSQIQRIQTSFEAKRLHWTRFWSLVVLGHYLSRNPLAQEAGPAVSACGVTNIDAHTENNSFSQS